MSSQFSSLKEMQAAIEEVLPPQCELTKCEIEGPQVVLYLKNIRAFYEDRNLITKLASRVRKKITLRSDSSVLLPPEAALEKIRALVPPDAGIADIKFDTAFNEVVIEALKPGVVIGKGGLVLKSIVLETGWNPRILRAPTSPSEVVRAIRSSLLHAGEDRKKFLVNLGKKMLVSSPECEWIKITALGGFREVGRSCTLLQTPKSNILVDCGLNVDSSDPNRMYPYLKAMNLALDQIDAVILTHAHLDHSGFLPFLYAYGYEGPLYCTPATRDLTVLLQQDCINVMNSEGKGAPYSEKDIKKMLNHTITREYGEVTDVTPEVRFTFYNAGHILGSSQVHLHVGEGLHNLVITGDFKYGRTKLLDPADTRFPRIETLIMESTYGGSHDMQPPMEEGAAKVARVVRQVMERRGKVLIPVFSVGTAQELMLILEEQFREEDGIKVYIDGMCKEASAIHTVYPEYLRHNIQRRILQNDSPFDKPLFSHVVSKNRKDIAESDDPAVILAPSGMLTGGTSVEFLKMLSHDERNALIFVGYQSATSLGRKIQMGSKEVPIINDKNKLDTLKVNLQVESADAFSGHSDRSQLISYVRALHSKPSRILTIHGDEVKCDDLARSLSRIQRVDARAPMNLDTVRLK